MPVYTPDGGQKAAKHHATRIGIDLHVVTVACRELQCWLPTGIISGTRTAVGELSRSRHMVSRSITAGGTDLKSDPPQRNPIWDSEVYLRSPRSRSILNTHWQSQYLNCYIMMPLLVHILRYFTSPLSLPRPDLRLPLCSSTVGPCSRSQNQLPSI